MAVKLFISRKDLFYMTVYIAAKAIDNIADNIFPVIDIDLHHVVIHINIQLVPLLYIGGLKYGAVTLTGTEYCCPVCTIRFPLRKTW